MAAVIRHPRADKTATVIRLRQRDPQSAFRAGVEHAQKMAHCADRGPIVWQPPRYRRPAWVNHLWAFIIGAAAAAALIWFGL